VRWGWAQEGNTVDDLTKKIRGAALEMGFSGVVSIFKEESTLLNQGFGYRDNKNKLPNTSGHYNWTRRNIRTTVITKECRG